MESGFPMLNCLLQHTLRSLCSSSDSNEPCNWVYAVFWRILPRNYPPPKWEYGGGILDRAKGNKRNWILVWDDGYCNFHECEREALGDDNVKRRFGGDLFFKMSHEVYNYGEGLIGKVAAENSHRWVFKPSSNNHSSCFTSWNVSFDHQPKAWENQFNSGIQTIALISVRDGIVQLGSLDKVQEDLNLVINTQRKFNYLENIPGIFTIPRPNSGIVLNMKPNNPYTIEANASSLFVSDKRQLAGSKRVYDEGLTETSIKSINLGWNTPQNGLIGPHMWSLPPIFPALSYNFGFLLSKPPYIAQSYDPIIASELDLIDDNPHESTQRSSPREFNHGARLAQSTNKVESSECVQEDKSCRLSTNHGSDDNEALGESRFVVL